MASVLIADDQVLVRAGFAALVEGAPNLTLAGQASNGMEAVEMAARLRPEVILMDIRMPDLDGIGATSRILAEAGERVPQIIIVTSFDLDEYVYDALRAGAAGFLLKDSAPEVLLDGIHTVTLGNSILSPSVTRRLIETFVSVPGPSTQPPPLLDRLTGREVEVLRLVGGGLSNSDIAEKLVISEATVKTHVNRTLSKLDVSTRAQAVVLAYETGLVRPRSGA
ncbi:response regulator [Catenulispora sp. GAS73]|uniref:response regulator n=1 Tax=Catenulispora sp. GAS73 TaxID=3156269 RepID=UPI00351809F8